ncbi:type II secretion system F family protein [Arthrobacter sp. NPDC080031]|uniref:type II secretion system F family protein n=2 Tax=unclassified Arthrobacter TaxID=235627 RepID=UPI00344FF00C
MGPAFPAIAVSLALIFAAILGLAYQGRTRRRIALRMLCGSPGRSGPQKNARTGEAAGNFRNPEGQEGLHNVPMILELVAAMLDSGAGLGRSLELIAGCASPQLSRSLRTVVAALGIGMDWETAWRSSGQKCTEARKLKDALAFAALTGAPSSAILYAQAARMRREQFRMAEKRAAALGVKLVIPLGLCSLPAFICFGVVPVLLAMLPSGG